MTSALQPHFVLHVVTSLDGFIARRPGHTPAAWASAEEQRLFRKAVGAADWGVMGRGTHEAAFSTDRRRIIFSRSAARPEWKGPAHLWLDPARISPDDLAPLVKAVRPMREAVVLGGTSVHDWFHAHRRLDRVELSIEPVAFGTGLPIFGDQMARHPVQVFEEKQYRLRSREVLNEAGTERLIFEPR